MSDDKFIPIETLHYTDDDYANINLVFDKINEIIVRVNKHIEKISKIENEINNPQLKRYGESKIKL